MLGPNHDILHVLGLLYNLLFIWVVNTTSCYQQFTLLGFRCTSRPNSSSSSLLSPPLNQSSTMASIVSKKKEKYTLKELKSLGRDLLSSRAHINNLPLLLSLISPESAPQFVVESLLSLQSFFTPLLSQLPSTSSHPSSTKRPRSEESAKTKTTGADDPEVIFKAWLRSKFDEFVKLLLDVLVSEKSEDTLRVNFLSSLCSLAFSLLWNSSFPIALTMMTASSYASFGL